MILPDPLSKAIRVTRRGPWLIWVIVSFIGGALVPLLVLTFGVIASIFGSDHFPQQIHIGRSLSVSIPDWLLASDPVQQIGWLFSIAVSLSIGLALLSWWTQLGLYRRSRDVVEFCLRDLLRHGLQYARLRGASAQQTRLDNLILKALPTLRRGVVAWWQISPFVMVAATGCLLLACLVDVWITALSVLGAIVIYRAYRWLTDDQRLGQIVWETREAQGQLTRMVRQAPLVARLQPRQLIEEAFVGELERLHRRERTLDQHQAVVTPIVALSCVLLACLVLFAVAGQRFDRSEQHGGAAAVVLTLSLLTFAACIRMIVRAIRKIRLATEAAMLLQQFMHVPDDRDLQDRVGISGLRTAVELNQVTLLDGENQPVLSHLTLRLEPRSLVALLGTDELATTALLELLLGFGQPNSGSVTIDGVDSTEIHPNSLAKQVFWVSPSGPIWRGTLRENLEGSVRDPGSVNLSAALEAAGIADRVSRLSEGLETVLTAEDDRLDAAMRYAIGITRALLRRPAIIVVQEPDSEAGFSEQEPLNALRQLAQQGSLVIVSPRRVATLRVADRVILLNGNRLAGEGKHAQLLADSDLYRHLNYLLFNPYSQKTGRPG